MHVSPPSLVALCLRALKRSAAALPTHQETSPTWLAAINALPGDLQERYHLCTADPAQYPYALGPATLERSHHPAVFVIP